MRDAGPHHLARRHGDTDVARLSRRFGDALLSGDTASVDRAVDDAVADGLSAVAEQSRVIAPAMRRVGSLWEQGAIGVAEEHLATALCHQALARLYPGLMRPATRPKRSAVVAAAHGEHHVLGLRMVADVLEGAGFGVRFFGPDVPSRALVPWVGEHEPDVVALGLTMPLGAGTLIRELLEIHAASPRSLLVVGGQGVLPVLQNVPGLVHVGTTEALVEAVEKGLAAGTPFVLPPDLAGGGVLWTGAPSAFSITEGIGTIEDRLAGATLAAANSAREQARRAFTLEQLAFHDPLTGLGNRRALDDRWATVTADPSATPPALIMIDVDRFKLINDNFGHDAGDRALTGLARCIERSVRPGDLPVRFGGDEFAVLLAATSAADATTVAERIRCTVRDELRDPQVSVSVGVGVASDTDLRATALDVDRALYEAKQQGRDQVAVA